MNNKLRNILLSFLIAIFITSPFLTIAQIGGTEITQAMLKDYETARVSTIAFLSSVNNNEQDAGFKTQLESLMNKCADLGDTVYRITKYAYSTTFSSRNYYCTAGTANMAVEPVSGFEKFAGWDYVVSTDTNNIVQSYLLSIAAGKQTKLDETIYTDIVKRDTTSMFSSFGNFVSQMVNMIIETSGNTIASVLAFFATMALTVLREVINYTQAWDAPNIVDRGWTITRDFMNIIFIIALILMGVGTILRLDAYSVNSKGLLFNLIVMALLINFSKVIADTLIGFSDMLVNIFRPNESILDFAKTINSAYLTGGDGFYGYIGGGRTISQGIGNLIGKVIALVVLTISYTAIAGLMFVREVGLWFLVMVSPAAYALRVIPYTKDASRMWWSNFIKYLTWGPIAMFFFRLGHIYMKEVGSNGFASSVIDNLFIAVFIYGGYYMAKRTGIYGGSYVTNYADKAFAKAKGYGNTLVSGTKSAAVNYGVVRGGLQGDLAKMAGGAVAYAGLSKDPDIAQKWHDKVGTGWGKTTAKIGNIPSNFEQKWIKNPNADRDKLVKSEQRKMQIKRGYFKLDDDAAKKLSPEDLAFAIKQEKYDEGFLRSVLQHGTNDAKLTVVRAFAEGHIKEKQGFDAAQHAQLWHDYRADVFKMAGGEKDDPAFDEYLGGKDAVPQGDGMKDLIYANLNLREKKGYSKDSEFSDRVKNTYVRPKPVRKKKKEQKTPTTQTPQNDTRPEGRGRSGGVNPRSQTQAGFGAGRGGRSNDTPPSNTPPPANTNNPTT